MQSFLNARISVVVLTRNRREEVMRTVASLLRLPERPTIVVVDNGSTDGTAQLLAHTYPGLRVVHCDRNLGAAGRNEGVEQVMTGYVAFSDDDTDWQAGSLARAAELLDRHPHVGVLSARVVVGPERTLDPACALMAASPLRDARGLAGHDGLVPLIGFMAGACVFRTEVFRALGGYEPRLFIGGEEALLSLDLLQAGYRIAYAPELEVHHRPSLARDSELRRRFVARNAALVAWMRLPRSEALAATGSAIGSALRERHAAEDLRALWEGIRWAMQRRRPVAPRVLRMRDAVRKRERVLARKGRTGVKGRMNGGMEPGIDVAECIDPEDADEEDAAPRKHSR
ncbi:glycosyltransferase family 2 protein [Paraburkholderia mimosarum]|uniref:glycosyltransferase family 2 protein n=1 Tax=Paraburkholderia mimosarum TaxID=312026 RepID=UPI0004206BE7|nr:glycosyltransferase [Paraburkholderia mimosarum]